MTIIFFGSDPWFSPPVLEALLKAGHEVLAIVTKGEAFKNFRFQNSELKFIEAKTEGDITRERLGTTCHEIATPRHNGARNDSSLSSSIIHQPSVIILAAFGPPFLPAKVLSWPKYGCLNVHASLLPRWRGASPVFGAIANGDKETGVSTMKMTEEIDLGPVLGQKITIIRSHLGVRQGETFPDNDDRESLTRRLGILGGELIVETLKNIENGQIKEIKQPTVSPTPYTHRLTKESGLIDWKKSPEETCPERSRRIERFIRAVTPWPGAFTSSKFLPDFAWAKSRRAGKVQSQKWQTIPGLKIIKAHLEQETRNKKQETMKLMIDEVQLPGKNPISWKAFLAGHPNAKLE